MNEVFQDLSTILDVGCDVESIAHEEANADIEEIVKDILDCDNASPESVISVEEDELTTPSGGIDVDLSSIIQETLGADVLYPELADMLDTNLDGDDVNTLPHGVHTDSFSAAFDLLDQLEALPAAKTEISIREAESEPISIDAVEMDHQYTQLASVKVKPHETKKQAIRRVKNNAASRVCRKQRKNKLQTNMQTVAELMAKNTQLQKSISEIESIVCLLKEHLVKATCKK